MGTTLSTRLYEKRYPEVPGVIRIVQGYILTEAMSFSKSIGPRRPRAPPRRFWDRFVAASKSQGTCSLLVFLSDCLGYVGTIALLFFKNFGGGQGAQPRSPPPRAALALTRARRRTARAACPGALSAGAGAGAGVVLYHLLFR